jgi:hypothetical protein
VVPASVNAPHQWVQDRRYYIRVGSSFEPIQHGVLAGLFGRHPQPNVFVNFALEPAEFTEAGSLYVRCVLMLVNGGSVVAEDLYASVLCESVGGDDQTVLMLGFPPSPHFDRIGATGRDAAMMGKKDFRLPPGAFVNCLRLSWELKGAPTDDLKLHLRVGCAGAPPYFAELRVSAEELQRLYSYGRERWRNPAERAATDWHKLVGDMLGINDPHQANAGPGDRLQAPGIRSRD